MSQPPPIMHPLTSVADAIRQATVDGEWSTHAQRAAAFADCAPALYDACTHAYFGIMARKAKPKELEYARDFCFKVIETVARALGHRHQPYLSRAGLDIIGRALVEPYWSGGLTVPDDSVRLDDPAELTGEIGKTQ